jgi:hypothetical protein
VLQPGTAAIFHAGWWSRDSGHMSCPSAAMLEVTPPDEFAHMTIPVTWELAPCERGEIDVTSIQPVGT